MRRRSLLVVTSLAATFIAAARAEELPSDFQRYRPGGPVHALAAGPDGRLWVGTGKGLLAFDGLRFVPHGPQPLAGEAVGRLAVAGDGALWVAKGLGGVDPARRAGRPALWRLAGDEAREVSLEGAWVSALVADGADGVWVGTDRGLARVQASGAVSAVSAFAGRAVLALARHPDGALAVGTAAGLAAWPAERSFGPALPGPVTAVHFDSSGALWATTPRHLVRVEDGQRIALPGGEPRPALASLDGALWLGGMSGLHQIVPGPELRLVRAPDLAWVEAVLPDREGSLWVGLRTEGLVQRRPIEVESHGHREGLPGHTVFAVLVTRRGDVVATTDRGVALRRGGTWTAFLYGAEVPSHAVRSMAEGRTGDVWITNGRLGLIRFDGTRFAALGRGEGVAGEDARAVAVDGAGDLWVGWSEGGVTRYPGERISAEARTFRAPAGPCPGEIAVLVPARQGGVWAAGPGGVARVADGAEGCLSGLPAGGVRDVREGEDGALWFLPRDAEGVWRRDPETGVARPLRPGPPVRELFALAFDARGDLWLTSRSGVHVVGREALALPVADALRVVSYNAAAGMRSQECTSDFRPALQFDGSGFAWVATLEGLARIVPPAAAPRARADVVIEELRVAGRTMRPGAVRFPRDGADLTVRVSAASFISPERLGLRHRLLGLDDGWRDAGPTREIHYARVGTGAYTLEVEALDHHGRRAGRPLSLGFVVPPPLWRTWPFVVTVAAGVLALLAGLHGMRLRQLAARQAAVEAERARIARDLHDGLAQGYGAVRFQLDGLRISAEGAPELQGRLETARQTLDDWHREARQAIWDIRSLAGGRATVSRLLRSVVEGLPRPPNIRLDLHLEGTDFSLPGDVARELDQLTREAVVNAFRHAEPSRVDVTALGDEDGLHLVIEDDGRGIDAASAAGPGVGLVGMRERALRLGATLKLGRRPEGPGTEVRLFVPSATLREGTVT